MVTADAKTTGAVVSDAKTSRFLLLLGAVAG